MNYSSWNKITLFKHGLMEEPGYAYEVVKRHFDKVALSRAGNDFVVLELGPGDSLFSAMIACALGVSCIYLIDVDDFARKDLQPYLSMANFLKKKKLVSPKIDEANTIHDLLEACNARYMTSGIASLRTIPDQSVDFIWSQAVLEHVRRSEFSDVIQEFRRIIRDDGISSHCIDLRDHLGGALNNLRFSERLWESDFMAKSGFYTNRIRYTEMLRIFERAGFNAEATTIGTWDKVPTSRSKLSQSFRGLSDEDLQIAVFEVLLKPNLE